MKKNQSKYNSRLPSMIGALVAAAVGFAAGSSQKSPEKVASLSSCQQLDPKYNERLSVIGGFYSGKSGVAQNLKKNSVELAVFLEHGTLVLPALIEVSCENLSRGQK